MGWAASPADPNPHSTLAAPQPNLLVPPALLPGWWAPLVPQNAQWGLRELQPHSTSRSLDSPLQGPPLLALPVVAALLVSACLPRPGGQGAGSEKDGAPQAGRLPVTRTWPHRTHTPTGEPGIPLGLAPEDAPHRYLSACTGKKKRKEGKEQPQAGAARSCGLRGSWRHCGDAGLAREGRGQEVVMVV